MVKGNEKRIGSKCSNEDSRFDTPLKCISGKEEWWGVRGVALFFTPYSLFISVLRTKRHPLKHTNYSVGIFRHVRSLNGVATVGGITTAIGRRRDALHL